MYVSFKDSFEVIYFFIPQHEFPAFYEEGAVRKEGTNGLRTSYAHQGLLLFIHDPFRGP
jgi:hypothetical protein